MLPLLVFVLGLAAANARLQRSELHAGYQEPLKQANGFQYGVQMDAGSSHTTVYVYKWKERVFDTVPPSLTQIEGDPLFHDNQEPGISDFAENPSGAGPSIQGLLDSAQAALKKDGIDDVSGVPVFLGATAGMRMLPPAQVTAILHSVRSTVATSKFMYEADFIRVLSGEEEGVFGWLAANWLQGTFQGPSDKTYGALDLGGASTQTTFHPDEAILADFFPLDVARTSHQLYTHSYLYYGNDQARFRMLDSLVNESTPLAPVTNPCYPKGFSQKGGTVSPGHPDVSFTGSSDWQGCMAQTKKLITDLQPADEKDCMQSSHSECTFAGAYMPSVPEHMDMLAVSTFFYVWNFFELKTGADARSDDLNALKAKAKAVCSMSNDEYENYVKKVSGGKIGSRSYNYCAGAGYIHALLSVGYGLDTENTPIRVTKDINGLDAGWQFGAMLYEINRLNWSYNGPSGSEPATVPNPLQGALTAVSVCLGLVSVVAITAVVLLVRRGACRKGDTERQSMYDEF